MAAFCTFTAAIYISDVLEEIGRTLPMSTWVLIRCLDSTRDPELLRSIADRHGISSSIGGYPAVEARQLAMFRGLFSHFDELWFFSTKPHRFTVKTDQAWLTSDAVDLDAASEWDGLKLISATGSFLAIGDGDFANIVVASDAARWLPHVLRDPRPPNH